MKKNILSAAIAVVTMTAFSQASFAIEASVTPDLEVFLSGASAQDKGIDTLIQEICKNGTGTPGLTDITVFKDNGGTVGNTGSTSGKKHTAWFCTIKSAGVAGLSATKKVLFHKRSDGGSAMGVSPLLADTAIAHMVIKNSNCIGTGLIRSCRISNAGDLVNHKSDAGLSDVNPEMFTGALNTPAGFDGVVAADVAAKLVVRPSSAVIFGVPVGLNLYKALQQAQGLIAGGCTAGQYTEACLPNLNHAQVASLLSGQVKSWDELSFGGVALTAIAGVTPPTDPLVHICKRTAGSGTGAQMYAKFLNNPCTEGTLTMSLGDAFTGPIVHENAESGELEACQDDLSKGNVVAKDFYGDLINQGAQGDTAWSIGVQALEKNSDELKAYRFVKIDGAAPTLANAFNGSYSDWVEATWQYRNTTKGGPTGDTLKIIDKIIKDASSPERINAINKTHTFGKSGYLAVAANGYAVTDTLNPAKPVMPYTHAAAGSLNNCAAPAKSVDAAVISVK
jgi:hypothetical protein